MLYFTHSQRNSNDRDVKYYDLRLQKVLTNFSLSLLFELFHKFIFRVNVSNPALPPPQSGHAPPSSQTVSMNFDFDIRPRGLGLLSGVFVFGKLILRKASKIGATRCQILRLKCTKFDFRWGSVPDPTGGAYSAPPDLWLYLRRLLLRGGRGRGRWEEKGRKREGDR